jgi:hypothetical protein
LLPARAVNGRWRADRGPEVRPETHVVKFTQEGSTDPACGRLGPLAPLHGGDDLAGRHIP